MGGSSPLARGKCCRGRGCGGDRGFIPTRAGKIMSEQLEGSTIPVHPHSRGENPWERGDGSSGVGSSPLARGKFVDPPLGLGCDRFIPTRAGKMLPRLHEGCWDGVHPHSRGENYYGATQLLPHDGSSPLARGKCGGRRASRLVPRVHPHSRGENLVAVADLHPLTGSSPLARGKCYRG